MNLRKLILSAIVLATFMGYVYIANPTGKKAALEAASGPLPALQDTTSVPVASGPAPVATAVASKSSVKSTSQNTISHTISRWFDDEGDEGDDDGRHSTTRSSAVASAPSVAQAPAPVSQPASQQQPVSQPVTTPAKQTTTNSSGLKDGTYTGPSINVFYGNVQVAATISGGKITDVRFLDYPQDRRTSLEKSQMSMPILRSEAISAQSANVDAVSGATATSDGFTQSLSAALAQAK